MYTKSSNPSFGSVPEPDINSGATALQTTSINETATSPAKYSHSSASQRAKPNIPQKKTHVDEMFRLKRELEEALKTRDEAVEMRDMIAGDLLTAQEELKEKDDELSKWSKEAWTWRDKAENLSSQITKQKTEQSLIEKEAISATGRKEKEINEAEQRRMQQQIDQLTAALAEKDAQLIRNAAVPTSSDEHLRSHSAKEQTPRQVAKADLRSTKGALDEHTIRMETQSTSEKQHKQVIATYEAELRDQRQRCNQFRKTSERLTTQIKQANEAKRNFERSDTEMRQQIENLKSQVAALQTEPRSPMPFSFSGGPSSAPLHNQRR